MKLPTKTELKGQRFGQLITNAILTSKSPHYTLGSLFYMENEDLEELLNQYLSNEER